VPVHIERATSRMLLPSSPQTSSCPPAGTTKPSRSPAPLRGLPSLTGSARVTASEMAVIPVGRGLGHVEGAARGQGQAGGRQHKGRVGAGLGGHFGHVPGPVGVLVGPGLDRFAGAVQHDQTAVTSPLAGTVEARCSAGPRNDRKVVAEALAYELPVQPKTVISAPVAMAVKTGR